MSFLIKYKFILVIVLFVIYIRMSTPYKGKSNKDFIKWLKPFAVICGITYNIPYKFIIAQISLESGYGKSLLSSKYFNFGGQKIAKGSSEPFVEMMTTEEINGINQRVKAKFRKFSTLLDGINEYGKFFHKYKRYKPALKETDPLQFAIAIKKAGYATDSEYIYKISWILNHYKDIL